MKYIDRKKAVLLLSDGSFFEGYSIGHVGTTTGELCFNTGMSGYQEIFTDPSYFGQILVNTHTHIGNYGVIDREAESDSVKIAGLVVKNFSHVSSREGATGDLQTYLEKSKTVGISDIDTRALVRHLRSKGAMNGIISSEEFDLDALKLALSHCPNMEGLELASVVSTKEAYTVGPDTAKYKVSALDYGIKRNIVQCMVDRGCQVKVFPAKTSIAELLAFNPDGIFLSNGPGDPAPMTWAVETVKEILAKDIPLFGICLGHQVLSMAMGLTTYKMHHGHRGINHPVKNLIRNMSEVTSQNHGFAVSLEEAQASPLVEVTHINLNDQTLEGIRVKGKRAYSVQYHPEASPGPHDSRYLFDEFVGMMGE
jgi:carbamoyl-phosphate synthase small subunit